MVASYRTSLERHVRPALGRARLADVTAVQAQALVDRLVAQGLAGQSVRNIVTALGVVYRFARRKGYVTTNPTHGLELPQGASARKRIVDPNEARTLLEPLPTVLRAIYGLAIFAGLRRGEIAGLDWTHIRFDEGVIVVDRAYCWRAKAFQAPKTDAGTRTVPMFGPLAAILLDWRLESGGEGLVFPSVRDRSMPFDPRAVGRRADTAWKQEARRRAQDDGRDPAAVATWNRLILHEGRHSAASAYIASGEDVVQVAAWLGHSEKSTTLDRYAKAFEAREKAATDRVNAFYKAFERATVAGHDED